MVKIWIYFVYGILLLSKTIESLHITVFEDSKQEYVNISCPENKTIRWKSLIYGESQCQDTSNSDKCRSNIKTHFNENCLEQNNCTLSIEILKGCERPPRGLKVVFECKRKWWAVFWKKYWYPSPVDTCTNTLQKVNCPSKYRIKLIDIRFNLKDMDTECVKNIVSELCEDELSCQPGTTGCLFQKRFASIHYTCKGPTDLDLPVTESIASTSANYEVKMTTIEAANAPTENDKLPKLTLDGDHRVQIFESLRNLTQYLCSVGWDDIDAEVLCKSFNRTWIGNAILVDKFSDISITPISLHCGGHEANVFLCNFTEDEEGCNTNKVAGAICSKGTDIPGESVKDSPPKILASVKSGFPTLGVAVGVSVGTIGMICIIATVVLIRRRCTRENSDKKFSNFMSNVTEENYLGQQDIALPQYPTNNKVLYSQVQKRDTDTTRNEDGQDCSHPSKDTESPYALSEEGVYDKTDDRRHVVNDTDMYSRTVDTVYDSAEQHLKEDRKEETYDHFFGQKTEDYYDQTTRT